MARNNFEVDGKKYCLFVNGDNWSITDYFGNVPPDSDAEHPDFHKTAMAKFEELKTAGYLLWQYRETPDKKKV